MSLKPREFIKKIRECKTLDEERCLVNKESAEIRNLSKVRIIIKKHIGTRRKIFNEIFIKMHCNESPRVPYRIYSHDLFRIISKSKVYTKKIGIFRYLYFT